MCSSARNVIEDPEWPQLHMLITTPAQLPNYPDPVFILLHQMKLLVYLSVTNYYGYFYNSIYKQVSESTRDHGQLECVEHCSMK